MMKFTHLFAALAVTSLMVQAAHAGQLLEARDGGVVTGTISANGVTRLSFTGDAAASVQMGQGGDGPGFSIAHEPTTGDLYLTLTRDPRGGERAGAASFFVTTREGFTYQVELSARDVPSTQIDIRNPEIAIGQARARAAAAPMEARIVSLTRAMWAGALHAGFEMKRPFQRERVAGSLRLTVATLYESPDLTGRVLNVRNRTKGAVPVDEAAFMAPGVLSVTLKGPRTLQPGETAQVFVVDAGSAWDGGGAAR